MRKVLYYCDCCEKELGDNPHIHVRNAEVAIAHKQMGVTWKDRYVRTVGCKEYQFCNVKCLSNFLEPKVAQILDEIKANPTS